jgi:hypothetical protein
LRKAFNIPYNYDYITKWCRQQAEVVQNHENQTVRNIWHGESQHRKRKRLKLGGGSSVRPFKCLHCCCSVNYKWWGMICCTEPVLTVALYILYIHKTCVTCKLN